MTKEELLQKSSEIEWDDFECKAAQDKMLAWERLTKSKVEFSGDLISSTITYWLGEQVSGQVNFGDNETVVNPKDAIGEQVEEQSEWWVMERTSVLVSLSSWMLGNRQVGVLQC